MAATSSTTFSHRQTSHRQNRAQRSGSKRNTADQTVLNPAAFNSAISNLPVGSSSAATTVGDFNRDGQIDLVITLASSAISNNVSVFLGSGNGSFGSATSFATGGLNPLSIINGDFNGDGSLDLVAANSGSNTVSLLAGNGAGGFGTAQTFRVGGQPNALTSGDFNRDGQLDVVTANTTANTLSVLLGEAGGFRAATSLDVAGTQPFGVASGDFDRDGNLDLVSADLSGSISVFLGRGNGNFKDPVQFFVGGGKPTTVVTGDFNEDNKLDIATGNIGAGTQNLTVMFGDGKGDFSDGILLPLQDNITSLVAEDLNGDDHLDLAALSRDSSVLTIYSGNGDRGFTRLGNEIVNASAQGLTAADLDQDGKTDLVMASASTNNATILLNQTSQVVLRSSKTQGVVDGSQETDSSLNVDLAKGTLVVNSSPVIRVSVEGFKDVEGTQLRDKITGGNGKNSLNGLNGQDTVVGLEGNDILVGGIGSDRLTGDQGKDRFVFDHEAVFSTSQGSDRITDFEKGRDKIVLDRGTFTVGKTLGANGLASVESFSQAQTSAAAIIYVRSTGRLYYNSNGATAGFGSGGLFATLVNKVGNLAAADFVTQA